MSGTSFSWSSNLYRPEKVLRKMSMSTAADIFAGSRLPTSSTIGKLRVWSDARFSDGCTPPPHAATTDRVPSATARERNTAIRLIPPPTKHGSRRAHRRIRLLDVHRPLPGRPGRECAGDGPMPSPLQLGTAPLLHAQFWALVHRSQVPMTIWAH